MTTADEIRAHLKELGFSQREAASELGMPERDFRYWCAGEGLCPPAVIFALRWLVEQKRQPETVSALHKND